MKRIEAAIWARAQASRLARSQAHLNAVLAMLVRSGAVDEEQWSKAVAHESEKLIGMTFTEIVESMTQENKDDPNR